MNDNGQARAMRPTIKVLLAIIVVAIGWFVMGALMKSPVKASTEARERFVPRVEVVEVNAASIKVVIDAQGMVEPVTQTMLLSEVAGAIEWIAPELKAGGHFKKGETMLRISRADYESQLAQAKARVADAELQIEQEKARAQQALRDWKKLGRGGEPSSLVKREPQLKSAEATLVAAKAAVVQSERDLLKTEVKAPYDCLVRTTQVDLGGYLTAAGRIAEIYEADRVQVRLPLSLEDVTYLPEKLVGVPVVLSVKVGRVEREWQGKVVRTEGVVDRATMTMMTVVEVNAADVGGMFELPPFGLFVQGEFQGDELTNVVKLPRVALRDGSTAWIVDADGNLEVRKVKAERSERDYAYVIDGLTGGELVIVSPIEVPVSGMPLEVAE